MTLSIDADFPGGNIVVERIEADTVYLHQDLRDTTIPWFYWCFRLRAAQGRRLRFVFTQSRALGVRGPAVSFDRGRTWEWVGSAAVEANSFTYRVPADADDLRLSYGMPYQLSHWQTFVAGLPDGAAFSLQRLCVSEQGRDVPTMLIEMPGVGARQKLVVTCRHHCCEMMANYVLEGLVRWVLRADEPQARRFGETVDVLLVPFVDLDGVEVGDQGKCRAPRDHGRDYGGESLYAAPRALRALLPEWGGGSLRVCLDLHCPHIAGPNNEVIYQVGKPRADIAREQQRLSELLEAAAVGPLPFRAADFLPFGQAWNTGKNYDGGKGFAVWAAELPGVVLSTSIETPYASAGGVEVNAQTARLFGEDLGRGLAAYCAR